MPINHDGAVDGMDKMQCVWRDFENLTIVEQELFARQNNLWFIFFCWRKGGARLSASVPVKMTINFRAIAERVPVVIAELVKTNVSWSFGNIWKKFQDLRIDAADLN